MPVFILTFHCWILYCKYVGRDFWIVDADGSEIEGKTF